MTFKLILKHICVVAGISHLMLAALPPASAATINLGYSSGATAEDQGPQDGVFDAFSPLNLGAINNNGFTSLRTALEFNISSIPAGSSIVFATLDLRFVFVEGTRSLMLHGYAGDGTIQLDDFSRNGFVAGAVLPPGGNTELMLDATGFIQGLVNSHNAFAGFNLREDPANVPNFTVFRIEMTGPAAPLLSINFVPVPEPSVICLLGLGLISLMLLHKNAKLRPYCAGANSRPASPPHQTKRKALTGVRAEVGERLLHVCFG
jgi:hypothetical protein